jgi:hypothetical protein
VTKFVLCGKEYEYLVLDMNFRLQIAKRILEVISLALLCRVCETHSNTHELLNSSKTDNAVLLEEAWKEIFLGVVQPIETYRLVWVARGV